MFIEDWNFNTATNMSAPLNQQMFQASHFLLLLSYSDKCLLERFDSDKIPIVLLTTFMEKRNRKTGRII